MQARIYLSEMFAPARRSYDNSHHVQNKTRLTAGLIYGWRTRIIRAACSPCGPPPRRRSDSLRSLVEPEVLIPVRINKNPPEGGFQLWLADQDYSRSALTLRAAAVTATF